MPINCCMTPSPCELSTYPMPSVGELESPIESIDSELMDIQVSTADWVLLLLLLWPLTGGYLVALLTVQHLGSICLPWIMSSSTAFGLSVSVCVSGGRNVDVPEIGIQNLRRNSFFRGSVVNFLSLCLVFFCCNVSNLT